MTAEGNIYFRDPTLRNGTGTDKEAVSLRLSIQWYYVTYQERNESVVPPHCKANEPK